MIVTHDAIQSELPADTGVQPLGRNRLLGDGPHCWGPRARPSPQPGQSRFSGSTCGALHGFPHKMEDVWLEGPSPTAGLLGQGTQMVSALRPPNGPTKAYEGGCVSKQWHPEGLSVCPFVYLGAGWCLQGPGASVLFTLGSPVRESSVWAGQRWASCGHSTFLLP